MHALARRVARTRFSRHQINKYAMLFWVCIIRTHLCSLLCAFLVDFGPYLNFWLETMVQVGLFYSSSAILRVIQPCERRSYDLVSSVVKKYTEDNAKLWKKIGLLLFTLYAISILQFVTITSSLLVTWLLQNLVYCGVIDCIEERKIEKAYGYISRKLPCNRTEKLIMREPLCIVTDHVPQPSPKPPRKPEKLTAAIPRVVAIKNTGKVKYSIPFLVKYIRKKKMF